MAWCPTCQQAWAQKSSGDAVVCTDCRKKSLVEPICTCGVPYEYAPYDCAKHPSELSDEPDCQVANCANGFIDDKCAHHWLRDPNRFVVKCTLCGKEETVEHMREKQKPLDDYWKAQWEKEKGRPARRVVNVVQGVRIVDVGEDD